MKENNIIRLNESQLKQIVAESVKRVLNEGFGGVNNVPEQYKKAVLKKVVAEHPELDPEGFFWIGNNLKHNGKKLKMKEQEIISKPKGMGDLDYLLTLVPKYNRRFANGLSKLKEISSDELSWKPLDVSGIRKDSNIAEQFSNRYWICNLGAVTTENPSDVNHCHLSIPYFDKSTKRFQINLRIYDINGNEIDHLCPSALGLVKKSFGVEVAKQLFEIEKAQILKGTALDTTDNTEY